MSIFIPFYCFCLCFTSLCKSELGISGGVWLVYLEIFWVSQLFFSTWLAEDVGVSMKYGDQGSVDLNRPVSCYY